MAVLGRVMAQRCSAEAAFAYAAALSPGIQGRSGDFRDAGEQAGLAYVVIIPCDLRVTTAAGTAIRADQAAGDAAFERRSCGAGSKGPGSATGR